MLARCCRCVALYPSTHSAVRKVAFKRTRDELRLNRSFATEAQDEPCGKLPERTTVVHSSLARGCMDYIRGWAWQQLLLNRRLAVRRSDEEPTDADIVLLLEHHPVYTLGRGANENHLIFLDGAIEDHREARRRLARSSRGFKSARLSVDRRLMEEDLLYRCEKEAVEILCNATFPVVAPNGAPVYRVERGGEVTYHGPGQLVVYPLFDLRRHKTDLHWFLRMVEEVVILTLKEYDIEGLRDVINTGVWVNKYKVAAVGVSSSRWITTHGFALNVSPDLSFFDTSFILPCGIEGRGVTSISAILSKRGDSIPTVQEVAYVVLEKLRDVFEVEFETGSDIF